MDVVTEARDRVAQRADTEPEDSPHLGEKLAAFLDLTKPRITFLVTLSALAGFALGSPDSINWTGFLHVTIGIALLSSGIGTLNQYLERDKDALMQRTQGRPIPSGKLTPISALLLGTVLSVIAVFYLAYFLNSLTALLGFIAFSSYLFLYTPLKTRTHWCTFIGAFPGALPPVLGWTAARNQISIESLILFAILFCWQFPHFHAISTMYCEEYRRAGIRMLPVVESDGRRTAREIIGYTLALVLVSLLPTMLRLSGWLYFTGAVMLGVWFLYAGITAAKQMSRQQARRLLKASVLYLPLLLGLMVFNR